MCLLEPLQLTAIQVKPPGTRQGPLWLLGASAICTLLRAGFRSTETWNAPDDNNVNILKAAGDAGHGPAMHQVDLQVQQLPQLHVETLRARVVLRQRCEQRPLQAHLHCHHVIVSMSKKTCSVQGFHLHVENITRQGRLEGCHRVSAATHLILGLESA